MKKTISLFDMIEQKNSFLEDGNIVKAVAIFVYMQVHDLEEPEQVINLILSNAEDEKEVFLLCLNLHAVLSRMSRDSVDDIDPVMMATILLAQKKYNIKPINPNNQFGLVDMQKAEELKNRAITEVKDFKASEVIKFLDTLELDIPTAAMIFSGTIRAVVLTRIEMNKR